MYSKHVAGTGSLQVEGKWGLWRAALLATTLLGNYAVILLYRKHSSDFIRRVVAHTLQKCTLTTPKWPVKRPSKGGTTGVKFTLTQHTLPPTPWEISCFLLLQWLKNKSHVAMLCLAQTWKCERGGDACRGGHDVCAEGRVLSLHGLAVAVLRDRHPQPYGVAGKIGW